MPNMAQLVEEEISKTIRLVFEEFPESSDPMLIRALELKLMEALWSEFDFEIKELPHYPIPLDRIIK